MIVIEGVAQASSAAPPIVSSRVPAAVGAWLGHVHGVAVTPGVTRVSPSADTAELLLIVRTVSVGLVAYPGVPGLIWIQGSEATTAARRTALRRAFVSACCRSVVSVLKLADLGVEPPDDATCRRPRWAVAVVGRLPRKIRRESWWGKLLKTALISSSVIWWSRSRPKVNATMDTYSEPAGAKLGKDNPACSSGDCNNQDGNDDPACRVDHIGSKDGARLRTQRRCSRSWLAS